MVGKRREHLIAGAILVGYVLLALAFSLGPIFEGPDEIEHYRYIQFLARYHTLPDPHTQVRSQYHHPPLYYALAAPLILLTHDDDFAQIDGRLNPYYPFLLGFSSNDNKNLYLHTRAEDFPYSASGTAHAVHLLRLLSVALGAGTVLICYAIFRLLWPDRPDRRLLALGVVAFMPQFLYLSSTVNLDNLLFLLTTLVLWLLLRLQRDGLSWRGALVLGLALGAALLTKVIAGFLVFPVGLFILWNRRTWRYVPLILGVILVIAGWWYVRNIILYGEPTGVSVLLETWKTETIRPGAIALDIGLTRLPYAYQTFWARFGQGAVPVAPAISTFFDLLLIASLAGVIVGWMRTRSTRPFVLVAVFGLAWIAALVYYSSTAWSGNQGRYLLTGIAALGVLVTLGLDTWTPRRFRVPVALGSLVLFAGIAAVCVFGYFLPSYRVSSAPSEQIERPLLFRYGDTAELIGMSPALPKAQPGETIHITLYWRALHPAISSLQTYLHSANSDVVKRDSLPATGNLLSTDWQPGETWSEQYLVPIPADTTAQIVYPLLAGLYDPAAKQNLPVTDEKGQPVTPVIGRIAINAIRGNASQETPAYRFGSVIGLAEPRIRRDQNQIEICLRWLSLAPVTVDYNVFIHVLANGVSVAQADRQPTNGQYPTTAWDPGETINDCTKIDAAQIPPSGWQIELGLYDLGSSQRLPVTDEKGDPLPDSRVLIADDHAAR